jgi:hypothetical protein
LHNSKFQFVTPAQAGPNDRKEFAMCHAWEYELIKRAYAEEMQRRNRQDKEVPRQEDAGKPAEPAPRVRDKEPMPEPV